MVCLQNVWEGLRRARGWMWTPQGLPSSSHTLGGPGALAHGGWPTQQVCGGGLPPSAPRHLLGDRTAYVCSLYLKLETPGSGNELQQPYPQGALTVTANDLGGGLGSPAE